MKPTKLVMQAFGAYAEQTEIDFTQFEEKGLYRCRKNNDL